MPGRKALEAVEHLDPAVYQKEGGYTEILKLLDKRFPEKEKTDETAETIGEIFNLRAKEGEIIGQWLSRSLQLFECCERKTGVKFPSGAQGWMQLRWSGLSEEQQAVVKGRALGDTSQEKISTSMRPVYPSESVVVSV